VQSQFRASSVPATQDHAPRSGSWDRFSKSFARWKANPASFPYRLYAAFRSLREHTRLQFATGRTQVDLGPSLEFRGGYYVASRRTFARAEGIKRFLASQMLADSLEPIS